MSIVEVSKLRVVYNKKVAVQDIDFTVEAGESVGFMGRNGAGKSSTLKVLGGALSPTSGKVLVDGNDMSDYFESNIARSVTGYCPDVAGLIPQATLREHIGLSLSLHRRLDLWKQSLAMVELFDLEESIDIPVSGYSHGMARRASIILAAISSFSLLILDEPFDGVDRIGVSAVKELVKMANNNGVAVIISTHMQKEITETVDRIIVMGKGSILGSYPSTELQGDAGILKYDNLLRNVEAAKELV